MSKKSVGAFRVLVLVLLLTSCLNNYGRVEEGNRTLTKEEFVEEEIQKTPTNVQTVQPVNQPIITQSSFAEGKVLLEIEKINVKVALILVMEDKDRKGLNAPWGDFSRNMEGPMWLPMRSIGENGVTLIIGHRQWGPEPKVFASLDKVQEGDSVNVINEEYTFGYIVEKQVVINPQELLGKLVQIDKECVQKSKSCLVLETCTPYGTDRQRLLIITYLAKVR